MIDIKLCPNGQRQAVYELWYSIYYVEMQRNASYADHINKTIIDTLEPHSDILIVLENGKLVGSSRINYCYHEDLGYYNRFYQLDQFDPYSTVIVTRFMLEKHLRSSQASYQLASATVEFCKKNKKNMIVMDCSPRLYKFFEKLGFVNHIGIVTSPEYGEVSILKYEFDVNKGLLNKTSNQMNENREEGMTI